MFSSLETYDNVRFRYIWCSLVIQAADKGSYGFGFPHEYDEDALVFHGLCIEWYRHDNVVNDYRLLAAPHVNAGFIRYVGV